MIATSTAELYMNISGGYIIAMGMGITIASVLWIMWLILKARKGGAYADFTRSNY